MSHHPTSFLHRIIRITLSAVFFLFSWNIYAETSNNPASPQISLYEQPDTTSKVTGTVDLSKGIMVIFSKDGWTKIANPANGDVGWVKDETLKTQGISYIKNVIKQSNGPNQTLQTQSVQIGSFPTENQNEYDMNEIMKKWRVNQFEFQKSMSDFQQKMNQLMTQSIHNTEAMFRSFMNEPKPATAASTSDNGNTQPKKTNE